MKNNKDTIVNIIYDKMHFFFSETKYKCINLNGRTEDIIEMQEGNLVDDMDLACSVENMDDDNLPFTTLISMSNYFSFREHSHMTSDV